MTDDDMLMYYRERAPEYEQIYYREQPERRREIDDEIVRVQQMVADRTVLELACGTGYWTEVMSRRAASILAVDISEEMLAQARKKSYAGPVRFMRADLYALPSHFGRFDLVALAFWFSHHPRQHFSRLFDILEGGVKPGGRVWLIDNNPPAEGPMPESVGVDEHGNNYKKRRLDNGREYTIMKNYFSSHDLQLTFEPRFTVESLVYGRCYWSVVLSPRG